MSASKKQIAQTRAYKEKQKRTNAKAYKQKVSVRNKVTNAVRDGRMKKPSKADKCPNCGKAGFRKEWHHTDGYSSSKGEWRCSSCNRRPGQTKK